MSTDSGVRTAEVFTGLGNRWHKVRMLGTGKRHHRKSMRERRQVLLQFVRGTARGNEMNLIEVKLPVRGPCDGEMPVVNRIKRSAKQRDAAWVMFCGGARRLRGRQ